MALLLNRTLNIAHNQLLPADEEQQADSGFLTGTGVSSPKTGVVQHPFGIIRLGDRRINPEHGRIKTDTFGQVIDGNMDMETFHKGVFSVKDSSTQHISSEPQEFPAQQFSVRKPNSSFMAVKLAA